MDRVERKIFGLELDDPDDNIFKIIRDLSSLAYRIMVVIVAPTVAYIDLMTEWFTTLMICLIDWINRRIEGINSFLQ